MASIDEKRKEEHGGLSVARTEFASSLARRLEAIQSAIAAFEQQAQSAARRDNLIRRLHALGASAKVLGFAAAAESLARAEQQLRTGLADTLADDLTVVRSQLATLPTLVLRGTYSMLPAPPSVPASPLTSPSPLAQGPWCVLVGGSPVLADNLRSIGSASAGFELIYTHDTSRLREMCAMYGPDVVVIDGSLADVEDVLRTLRDAPEITGAELVVALADEGATTSLQQAGAHTVVASSLSPVSLWRAINRTRPDDYDMPPAREPLGDMALCDLCDRVSREIRRGLLEAANADAQSTLVSFGEGTEVRAAIWSAVARIREIVVTQSEGRVQFGPGPEGGIVLAPGLGMRGRTLTDSASIDLSGRRIVVADDDPAVAWFVAGTLRAAGAEVREARDGRRALALVHQWWPELVVSDVLMPGMDGFALCREIKRDVALRDVPVILLSWKEDLLFRLRELGADADGYLRKEASASVLVDRVRELLWPRVSLERRLRGGQEVRGRLDGITPRSLMDAACQLGRNLRILLRDASAHYEIRIRDGSLRAITRTRAGGTVERGETALAVLLGVSAGRFSVVDDDQPVEADFVESNLNDVLRGPILRARAAQRVLSGSALGTVERVTLDPETFADELAMLPLSLRPLVDELLRGTAPRQLLASGTASLRSLESLLSDAARRGAVRAIAGPSGEDLLTREILALSAPASEPPASEGSPPPAMFTFQLSPSPVPAAPMSDRLDVKIAEKLEGEPKEAEDAFDWTAEANWDLDVGTESEAAVRAERSSPFSRPKFSAEWGPEKRTSPGVGTKGAARKWTPPSSPSAVGIPIESAGSQGHTAAERDSNVNQTPELSQAVAAAMTSDRSGESPSTGPGGSSKAATVATPPRPAPLVEVRKRAEPQVDKQPSAALSPTDDEAIFPLFPSAAPDKRSQRNTPGPGDVPATMTTLSSELAPSATKDSAAVTPQGIGQTDDNASTLSASSGAEPPAAESRPERDEALSAGSMEGQTDSHGAETDDATTSDRLPLNKGANGWIVPLALGILAGILSFTVAWPIFKSWKPNPSESPSSEPMLDAVEAAPALALSAAPSESATGTPSAASAAREGAAAPPGVDVPPDKGLIVVRTGGLHSIFVDDEFIGRGPERVVTLPPGQHRVRASLNGEEHTETVEATAGRVIELSLEQPGK